MPLHPEGAAALQRRLPAPARAHGSWVYGLGVIVWGLGFRLSDFGVLGLGLGVWDFTVWALTWRICYSPGSPFTSAVNSDSESPTLAQVY